MHPAPSPELAPALLQKNVHLSLLLFMAVPGAHVYASHVPYG